jgi:alginate O-acetyltransferase complex protein AlgI
MMQRLHRSADEALAGAHAGVMAVFITSGMLHELAITLPVRCGFGLPTLYFTLHGILALLERRWGRPFGKIPALLAVILPMGLLFPRVFQNEVIARCLGVFDMLKSVFAG